MLYVYCCTSTVLPCEKREEAACEASLGPIATNTRPYVLLSYTGINVRVSLSKHIIVVGYRPVYVPAVLSHVQEQLSLPFLRYAVVS